MNQDVILAPDVILDPVSLSLNLAYFGRRGKIGVPLPWLWEELTLSFGLLSIADAMWYYSESQAEDLLSESIWFEWDLIEKGCIDPTKKLDNSLAILKTAYDFGIVYPFVTEYDRRYFESGGWQTWLLELFPKYEVIPFDKENIDLINSISLKSISKKYNIDGNKLEELIKRNENWSTRVGSEYKIYEDFRRIDLKIGQIFTACFNQYSISSSKDDVKQIIDKKIGLYPIDINNDEKILPIVELLSLDPHKFTISDIINIIENRDTIGKLGEIMSVLGELDDMSERLEIRNDLLVYILGFVPIIDLPLKIFEGVKLVSRKIKSFRKKDKNYSIYFDANKWKNDYKKRSNL
ncbi:MAG: hypothetical protein FNP40_08030 [Dehalobacter sp. 4CP]|nr:hypothetical protein [Dehalobacter sp. 4CP]